mgnify:CR=1 FL=1
MTEKKYYYVITCGSYSDKTIDYVTEDEDVAKCYVGKHGDTNYETVEKLSKKKLNKDELLKIEHSEQIHNVYKCDLPFWPCGCNFL